MKCPGDFECMSIEAITDVNNTFLSRREITCNFMGLGGKLKKLDAVKMVSSQFKLDGKVVIPMRLKSHVGKPLVTGMFYIYNDEELAKKHIDPTIFARLEKVKEKSAKEVEEKSSKDAEEPAKEVEEKTKDTKEKSE